MQELPYRGRQPVPFIADTTVIEVAENNMRTQELVLLASAVRGIVDVCLNRSEAYFDV